MIRFVYPIGRAIPGVFRMGRKIREFTSLCICLILDFEKAFQLRFQKWQ